MSMCMREPALRFPLFHTLEGTSAPSSLLESPRGGVAGGSHIQTYVHKQERRTWNMLHGAGILNIWIMLQGYCALDAAVLARAYARTG